MGARIWNHIPPALIHCGTGTDVLSVRFEFGKMIKSPVSVTGAESEILADDWKKRLPLMTSGAVTVRNRGSSTVQKPGTLSALMTVT